MLTPGAAVVALARRIVAHEVGDPPSREGVAAAAEMICVRLYRELGRWIGLDGCDALLARALDEVRATRPWLGEVRCRPREAPHLAGLDGVHGQDPAVVAEALVAYVAVFIELLGAAIGLALAQRLVQTRGGTRSETTRRKAMSGDARVQIRTLPSGVPGLDEVLGGGIPALSFNVIVGSPGTGKTTLALQMAFANATPEHPALCFTVLGEPTVKLLRHQQQFAFFDPARLGVDVHVFNLSEEILQGRGDMRPVLERIHREVATIKPSIVVIDSFRTLTRPPQVDGPRAPDAIGLERFMQLLAHQLTTWHVTAFLIGEYDVADLANPLFTVADGILWLSHTVERHSSLRSIQALKQRGIAPMAGVHTMRLTGDGVQVFPRLVARRREAPEGPPHRVSTGIADVDAMMGGGIVSGDSVIVTGPSGAGKTAFGMEFIAAAGRRGEAAVAVVFEEEPSSFLTRSATIGRDLTGMRDAGRLEIIALAPLDLSVDETLHELREAIARVGATCVVIDSLSGFELALAPSFREDFRESIYRVVRAVTATGVTVLMTVEVVEAGMEVRSPTRQLSFLADDILQIRYLEMQGEMRSVINVVKMRKSRHSRLLREYEVTGEGVRLGPSLRQYDSILVHSPEHRIRPVAGPPSGLDDVELEVLKRLIRGDRMTVTELADALALPAEIVRAALHRMVALGLAEGGVAPDVDRFRARAQPVAR